ncbi:hypothetical protein IMY05_001G0024500 [Salix suchowensis]|nr:hypothetical protein IMY05_001G0024500 [Salix suchowensis]
MVGRKGVKSEFVLERVLSSTLTFSALNVGSVLGANLNRCKFHSSLLTVQVSSPWELSNKEAWLRDDQAESMFEMPVAILYLNLSGGWGRAVAQGVRVTIEKVETQYSEWTAALSLDVARPNLKIYKTCTCNNFNQAWLDSHLL